MKQNRTPRRSAQKQAVAANVSTVSLAEEQTRQKYFDIAVAAILLALGIYNSVHFFGHKIMPTSDFPAFFGLGRTILSGHLPTDFMRGPVLGIMQVPMSYIAGGQSPALTGAWLLNAAFYCANLILLWLVGRRLIGNAAIWLAIIVGINAWTIEMMTDPIAETAMLFFILITFFLIFRQSRWSYVTASAASMLRYECAALILAAFVLDLIQHKTARERFKACIWLAAASLPLAFWMLETMLHWQSQGSAHYLKAFTPEFSKWLKDKPLEARVGLAKHIEMLWYVGFNPLFMTDPAASQSSAETLQALSKILVAISFLVGTIWGLAKKNWYIAALLIFFVPYMIIHSRYPYLVPRYYQTVFWIVMIVCWYGLGRVWELINKDDRVPRPIVITLQILLLVVAVLWINILIPFMGQLKVISTISDAMPYAAITAILAVFAAYAVIYKARRIVTIIAVCGLMTLIVFSNQFTLASTVSDGQRDAEFKQLGQWYITNSKPGEKLAVYMAGMTQLFVADRASDVVGIPHAENPSEFIEKCRKDGIVYIVWASREGSNPKSDHYMMARLDNIEALKQQRDMAPFKYMATLQSKYGYLNIFRLSGSSDAAR